MTSLPRIGSRSASAANSARFEIPNEQLQQFPQLQIPSATTPQLQTADNFETIGIASYQHIFSPNVLANLHGMVRDNSDDLNSNNGSWPIAAFLHNDFKEGYFNAAISIHHDRHEWKAGLESDNLFLHENFSDIITASPSGPNYPFDPGTPATFAFTGNRPDLEQSAYVQDLIHLGQWTVNAGLRWDHYQLVVNQNAVSPRISIARYFPAANLVVHASYDRVFQTPSFENILLASSPDVTVLNPNVFGCQSSLPTVTTSNSARPRVSSTSSASTRTISAVTSTTTPTTIKSSARPSAFP